MLVKTVDGLLSEILDLVRGQLSTVRSLVNGKNYFLNLSFVSDEEREFSEILWILRAQIGTLDKIEGLFVRDGTYETLELLAIARNLFENLVWVRLFNHHQQYGLIFYDQLLNQQMQNTKNMISKVESEIKLFEEYEELDKENLSATFGTVLKGEKATKKKIEQAQETHRVLTTKLDMRARRSFALYAAAAQFNGYSYQCYLLREKILPEHQATLARLQSDIDRLRSRKPGLLSPAMLDRSNSRWNWKDRATEVGMESQYNFLYSYTSKLLHSTPLNLITEKALSPSETLMMLEYAFVTISDLFDEIERFSFPGQANVLAIEV